MRDLFLPELTHCPLQNWRQRFFFWNCIIHRKHHLVHEKVNVKTLESVVFSHSNKLLPAQVHGEHVLGDFALVPHVVKYRCPSLKWQTREGQSKNPIPGHKPQKICLGFSEAKDLVLHVEVAYLKAKKKKNPFYGLSAAWSSRCLSRI